jgi:succinyl-CoA synthetase beta subunit/citryl-CoA synthetase large subunit
MRLLEHQSKTLLASFGIELSPATVAASPEHAIEAARGIGGPVVLKAQVPFGERGKAGAVLVAESLEQVGPLAEGLLAMELQGHSVRAISVEPRVTFTTELYAGVTWDSGARLPVAILSRSGGVDVESSQTDLVARRLFDPTSGLRAFEGREMASSLNLSGSRLVKVGSLISRLASAFISLDGVLVEINPLVETAEGSLIGLDARVELDDDAAARQRERLSAIGTIEFSSAGRVPTLLEREAEKIDSMDHRGVSGRVVEFDGDLALLIGGGGASLTVFDAIRRYGGRPANYCEVGGNPTEEKVSALTTLLLSKPGVRKLAVIMNVVNNTRADVMARGTIDGIKRAGRTPSETISVFRIPGSWEQEAREVLAAEGLEALGREISLDSAARLAVERVSHAVKC